MGKRRRRKKKEEEKDISINKRITTEIKAKIFRDYGYFAISKANFEERKIKDLGNILQKWIYSTFISQIK